MKHSAMIAFSAALALAGVANRAAADGAWSSWAGAGAQATCTETGHPDGYSCVQCWSTGTTKVAGYCNGDYCGDAQCGYRWVTAQGCPGTDPTNSACKTVGSYGTTAYSAASGSTLNYSRCQLVEDIC